MCPPLRRERLVVRRGRRVDERHVPQRPQGRPRARGALGRRREARQDRAGAPTMKVTVGATTDIGQVRDGNEDSYLLLEPLFAVADGMGGHLGGEVASNLALETIRDRKSVV